MSAKKETDILWMFKMKNKKGASEIISTVLLVGLVVVAVVVVGIVIRNIVTSESEKTESCFSNYNEVTINNLYTCYNSSNFVHISVSVGDLNVDSVLVAISGSGTTKTLEITNETTTISGLTMYNGSTSVRLPDSNAGLTYIYNLTAGGFAGCPDKIEIAPVINGKQCETSDTLSEIDNC